MNDSRLTRRAVLRVAAAGAAAVVDDQLPAGLLGELGRQRTRESVGAAARGEGHDHLDRLGGPGRCLRVRERNAEGRGSGSRRPQDIAPGQAGVLHLVSLSHW